MNGEIRTQGDNDRSRAYVNKHLGCLLLGVEAVWFPDLINDRKEVRAFDGEEGRLLAYYVC